MKISKKTKKYWKEAYETAKRESKETARLLGIQGRKVNAGTTGMANNITNSFRPIEIRPLDDRHFRHERRESKKEERREHRGYMDLRPRRPRRDNIDWNNLGMRF